MPISQDALPEESKSTVVDPSQATTAGEHLSYVAFFVFPISGSWRPHPNRVQTEMLGRWQKREDIEIDIFWRNSHIYQEASVVYVKVDMGGISLGNVDWEQMFSICRSMSRL